MGWKSYTATGALKESQATGPQGIQGLQGAQGVPGGNLLAYAVSTTPGNPTFTSSTLTDIDATHAAVTFVAPASGQVLVRVLVNGWTNNTDTNNFLGLREGSTVLVGSGMNANGKQFVGNAYNQAEGGDRSAAASFIMTGLTPGSSHTYKAAWAVNSGTATIRNSDIAPVVMEVWDAGSASGSAAPDAMFNYENWR